eukprot:gene3376-3864_t
MLSLESRRVNSALVIVGFISFVAHFALHHVLMSQGEVHVIKDTHLLNTPVTTDEYPQNRNLTLPWVSYFLISNRTWKFVFAYQWLWSFYSLLTLFRRDAIRILTPHFYVAWSISSYFEIGHLRLLSTGSVHWAWCCACSAAICRDGCLFLAFVGFFEYLAAYAGKKRGLNKFDVWCHRILIQNGLLCFQAWSTTGICMDFANTLTHLFQLSPLKASYCSILSLGLLTFIWFMLQNFRFEKYTRYTVAEYVTLVVMAAQIFAMSKGQINGTYALSLLFLCFVAILLVFRVSFMIHNEGERNHSSDDELEFMM